MFGKTHAKHNAATDTLRDGLKEIPVIEPGQPADTSEGAGYNTAHDAPPRRPNTSDTETGQAGTAALGQGDATVAAELPGLVSEQPDADEEAAFAQLKRLRAERRRKKLIKRGIAAGVVLAIVAGVLVWRHISSQQPAVTQEVVTTPAMRGPFANTVQGSGSIEPVSSTVIAPQIDGTIERVDVVAGQTVAEGDVLFTIKNDDLDRAVSEAERNVRTAKSDLAKAQKALKKAKEDKATLTKTATRQRAHGTSSTLQAIARTDTAPRLLKIDSPTYTDENGNVLEGDALAELKEQKQEAVDDAATQVESAQLQLEAANDAYDKAVEQADQRTVRAPSAGSILTLNAVPGTPLSQAGGSAEGGSGGPICQIADLSQMKVTVQVSEVDINKVAVDQTATATFSAVTDIALDATVRGIASTSGGDASGMGYYGGGSGGVTYAVDLIIPSPDPRLKPGMTANVSITTQAIDSAIIVPTSAVTDFGDGTGVLYVETDPETHAAREVMVDVLAKNASEAAVEPAQGYELADGDSIVVSGLDMANVASEPMPADGNLPADAQTGVAIDAGAGSADGADATADSSTAGDGAVVEGDLAGEQGDAAAQDAPAADDSIAQDAPADAPSEG